MQTTLAIVDDHRLFREGVIALLSAQPGMRVVGEAAGARDAFDVVASSRPDVVIVDLSLPGVGGIELARELIMRHPRQKLLALTMLRDGRHVAEAFDAGFLGYAIKDDSSRDLIAGIQAVARRERYLSPAVARLPSSVGPEGNGTPLSRLTRREREIFDLTVSGTTTAAIAGQLNISKRTVETHRARILHKLGAHSAVELVRIAARLGVLPQDVA